MPEVNAELLADIRAARESLDLFKASLFPVELWEQFCMFNGDRPSFRAEMERLRGNRGSPIEARYAERLTGVRTRFGPLVADLRKLAAMVPDGPRDERLEMVIGFMMISAKALEILAKWLFDAKASVADAGTRLGAIAGVVDTYRAALDTPAEPPPVAEPPAPAEPPPAAEAPPPPPTPPPPPKPAEKPAEKKDDKSTFVLRKPNLDSAAPRKTGADPEVMSDLRCADEFLHLIQSDHPESQIWETLSVVMAERDFVKKHLADASRLKSEGSADAAREKLRVLFDKVHDLREKHGPMVKMLRSYVESLPVGRFGKETMDLTIGFMVATPRGRARSQEWLDDPVRHKSEATSRCEDVIRLTMTYQTELRAATTV